MNLKSIRFNAPFARLAGQYPFTLPVIQQLDHLTFDSPVTIFVGENGSGKSTVLEGIAAAVGSITVGAESVNSDPTLQPARDLASTMKLEWKVKTKKGFFLRSEDFINFARRMSQTRQEMLDRLEEVEEEYKDRSIFAQNQAKMAYTNSIHAIESYYGEDLDARSHGESFFKLFHSRFVPGGLYLLDEPETPLSPMKQLTFISMLKEMVEQNSQFIIVTHSPILMAFPGAAIYNFDAVPVERAVYEELEHVQLTKAFLQNPERYLRHL
ncbi:AAA family ATPase [Paenibacillus marinisediminis]